MQEQPARHTPEWDVQFGVRNYTTGVGLQVVGSTLAFSNAWVATRVLGPAGYGGVAATIAATQLVTMCALQWSGHGLGRLGCEEFVDTGHLGRSFWTRAWILAASLALVLTTAPLWFPALAAQYRLPGLLRPLLFAHVLAMALWLHMQQALQAAKRPRTTASLLVAERVTVLVVMLVLVFGMRASPLTVMFAYVTGASTAGLLAVWLLGPLLGKRAVFDRAVAPRMLRYSLPLLPTLYLAVGSSHFIDALFVAHFLGLAQLAVYSVAAQTAGIVGQLPLLFGSLLLPYFVSAERAGAPQRLPNYLEHWLPAVAFGWALVCVSVGVIAQMLLGPVFGPQFESAARLIWPLLAASAASAPWVMGLAAATSTREKTRLHALTTATSAAVNIVLNVVLIPRFGLLGCAWSTAAAFAAATVVGSTASRYIVGVPTLGSLLGCTPVVAAALCASLGFGPWTIALVALVLSIPLWRRHGEQLQQLFARLRTQLLPGVSAFAARMTE